MVIRESERARWPKPFDGSPISPTSTLADVRRFHKLFGQSWAYFEGLGWCEWQQNVWVNNKSGVHRSVAKLGEYVLVEAQSIEDSIIAKGLNIKAASEMPEYEAMATNVKELRKHARLCESKRSMDSTLALAKHYLSAQSTSIGSFRLPCKNGVIDLANGSLLRINKEDFNLHCLDLNYNPKAVAPCWEKFISDTFGGDPELIEYMQRFLGYCITGSVEEHIVVIGHGVGCNGKSTLIEMLHYILKGFAKAAPSGLLTSTGREKHTTEIAFLKDARFVSVSETGREKPFDEERLKWLSGGDTLTARVMHGDNFNFSPSHKFFIVTNYIPKIKDGDEGIWRRIKLIPFENRVSKEQLDPLLPKKLRAEAEGVLSWLVRGAVKWRKYGLGTPAVIESATRKYRDDMDVFGRFLNECCTKNDTDRVSPTDLLAKHNSWAVKNSEAQLTVQALKKAMIERCFFQGKSGGSRYWKKLGIRI